MVGSVLRIPEACQPKSNQFLLGQREQQKTYNSVCGFDTIFDKKMPNLTNNFFFYIFEGNK
jgi:hypothetical protein